MLEAYAGLAEVAEAFAQVGDALGEDLAENIAHGDNLNSTVHTQPVMLAAGVGVWRAWRACGGPLPAAAAGHSVGEYAALVAAGALSLSDAATIVAERARAMQEAVPTGEGAMLAVLGLEADEVDKCCQETGDVWVANLNAPGQTVISGRADAVTDAARRCALRGAKRSVLLPVSVPSHCPLMQPARDRLAAKLAGIKFAAPNFRIVHNAGACTAEDSSAIPALLAQQLCAQVDWTTCAKKMAATADIVVECGPGKVLYNLNRRIIGRSRCAALDSAAAVRRLAAEFS